MPKTVIETTNARIAEVLAARNSEILTLTEKLEAAQADVTAAKAAAEAATAAADPEAFETAKQAEAKAQRTAAMFCDRLAQLNGICQVSAAENARTVAEIRAFQADLTDRTTAQIIALVSEIESVWNNHKAQMDAANDTLWRWHKDIYQQRRSSGTIVNHPADLKFDDGKLRWFAHDVITQNFFRENTGRGHHTGEKTPNWIK